MTPMVVDDVHSSQTNTMYKVILGERRHDFRVCLPAVNAVYNVTPKDNPHIMEASSRSAAVG